MGAKIVHKYRRRFAAKIRNNSFLFIVFSALILTFTFIMNQDKRANVIPASYQPLLNLIAGVESRGNYNAHFGNAHNTSVDFTRMSIAEVLQWQGEYVAQGSPSSAVGRYQIINTTLEGLVQDMKIAPEQLFDEATQDQMAVTLLGRRGSVEYANKEMSRQEFAANLAKEWASLPKVVGDRPDDSYYAGDGLNKSLVDKEKVFSAIDAIKTVKE